MAGAVNVHGHRPAARRLLALAAAALVVLGAGGAAAEARASSSARPAVAGKAGILIDRVTGRVLWSKRPDLRLPTASTTKIMSLLIVLESRRDRLDEWFEVPDAVAGSTGVGLQPGDRITYRQAITGMIVRSATDCTLALAADVAGTEDLFVVLMNRKARAWRLSRTRYTNASGAPEDPRHVTTARDLAALGRRAMRDALVREFVTIKDATVTWEHGSYQAHSQNWILDHPWGQGIKPGYTPLARYCLVAAGQPGLRPLISVTLREPSRARNMRDAAALLTWGSRLYGRRDLVAFGGVVARRKLPDGSTLTCAAGDALTGVVVRKAATVKRTLALTPGLTVKPEPGAYVGTATYRADGEKVGVVDLYCTAPPVPGAITPAASAAARP
jgi:D-alanyl-D-alanine carboxypeptidase (penicillin-binding protein 5/6)